MSLIELIRMANVMIGGILSIDRPDEEAISRISQGDFDLLQLVNGGEIWHDLQFLVPHRRKIHGLRVSGIFDGFRGLNELTELVHLNLEDYSPNPVLDLSSLTKLQNCKMAWSPKIVGNAFFSIPALRDISLMKYRGRSCAEIGLAKGLRRLTLRHAKLESLNGIAGCELLEELRLIQVKGLSSLAGIEACKALHVLEIEKGSRLPDVAESLQQCSSLTEVLLDGDFEVTHLAWIQANPQMTRFRTDAAVLDINWDALFGAPRLSEIAFKYVPHTLLPDDEIKAIATSHSKHVQWVEHGGTKRSPWIEIHFRKPTA